MTLRATSHGQPGAQSLPPRAQLIRHRASLAPVRDEFHGLVRTHAELVRRVAAVGEAPICSVDFVKGRLEELARRWFPPDVSRTIEDELERLSGPLSEQARSLAADVGRSPDESSDLSEQTDALERRVDEAIDHGRALFGELAVGLEETEARLGGLERTADALAASGLDPSVVAPSCVAYCRKVWQAGRGDGYLTLAGVSVVFQPLQKSGILFRKSDQIGPPEILDISPGLTISELRRPKLGDHGVTMRQLPPGTATIYLSLSPDALDDLIASRS